MSTPAETRALAAQLVVQVVVEGKSLDVLLARQSGKPQERGLLRSLCYGTLRWHIRLNAILDLMVPGSTDRLAPEVRALSLVGLFQLLHTDIAEHAAVSETVSATRVLKVPRAASLVNALLRRCQREGDQLAAAVDADLAVRTAHPRWLVDMIAADWPAEVASILAANNAHPPFWLRVNQRHCSTADYRERLLAARMESSTSPYAPDGLLLADAVDVKSLPGFDAGWVSVQDAAAQLAARLLQAEPGQRVLDACAAPGGKTCHLLESVSGLEEVVALDISGERLARVRENLERSGSQATLLQADAEAPETWWDGRLFDRILLDAPCSATGVIRRHPDIKLLRRATDIPALATRQASLLETLWRLLKPGGRLVYASCSVLKAENAGVVAPFLIWHRDATDVTLEAPLLPPAGRPYAEAEPGYRICPGEAGMDGFYYACLKKTTG